MEKKLYEERKEADRRDEIASVVSGADDGTVTNSDNSILPSLNATDLGFAKQKKYSWHPALKVGMLAKGTRVKVQFFGTGQTGIVDAKNWVTYSVKTESRIKSQELMKDVAFRNGLIELHNLHQKLMVDPTSVSAPGISFVPEVGARKFRNLDKERLQKEDDENTRLLGKQMVFDNSRLKWYCRDCDWAGKFEHKAKSHARFCGQRRVVKKRKSKNKFECGNIDCHIALSSYKELAKHYRYVYAH